MRCHLAGRDRDHRLDDYKVATIFEQPPPDFMSEHAFKVGDRVRFKTEWPPRIATVSEILEGGWLVLQWKGPPATTTSCNSEDVEFVRAEPQPPPAR